MPDFQADYGPHPGLPWPEVEALRTVLTDIALDNREMSEAGLRMLDRHSPVPNHGRRSDEGCPNPDEHAEFHVDEPPRPPVCKNCRDRVGEPIEFPCDVASDLGAMVGVDLLLSSRS